MSLFSADGGCVDEFTGEEVSTVMVLARLASICGEGERKEEHWRSLRRGLPLQCPGAVPAAGRRDLDPFVLNEVEAQATR